LEREELAFALPAGNHAGVGADVTIGADAAALVMVVPAKESLRALAGWVRNRSARTGSLEVTVTHSGRSVQLTIAGDIDVEVVVDCLPAAFTDRD
jgi:hypothetical protein